MADEIHLSKVVDALIAYLLDLIACAYKNDPSLIPARARFDINFVRKFRTVNDAVRGGALVEIERISRGGYSEILTEAKRVVNCSVPEGLESDVRKFVALRNSIVHGQGRYPQIIGSMFKKRTKPKDVFRHKPGDTSKAEAAACQFVECFEAAAIASGIPADATKAEVFTDVMELR